MQLLCASLLLGFTLPPLAPAAQQAAPAAAGATWNQWRGPNRDGQFLGAEWPGVLSNERLKLAWKVEKLGSSYASPVVTPTRVFSVGSTEDGRESVQAFARDDGHGVWEAAWEGSMKVPFFAARNGSWVRSTPAFDGEALFVAGMRDVLVCLEAADGSVRWQVEFMQREGTPLPAFGCVCSPLVDDDSVYVQAGAGFARLDKRTGATLWRSLVDEGGSDSVFSSPIRATLAGQDQLVVLTRAVLAGVAPASGDVLWSRPIEADRGMNILTPLAVGDALFTAPYGGKSQLLSLSAKDGALGIEPTWTSRSQGYMTSPVRVGEHLFYFSRANRFVCVDAGTGEETFVSPPTGDSYWSIVAQGERLLALSDTGILRLLAANPEEFTVLGEVDLGLESTWAHLAVVDGQLCVRALNGLYLYDWK